MFFLQSTGSAWHINVHEAIVWAFLEMYNNLHLDRLSSDSGVVQVDPEIQLEYVFSAIDPHSCSPLGGLKIEYSINCGVNLLS